jgi:Putative Ig domain/Galactose oxidase, central domain
VCQKSGGRSVVAALLLSGCGGSTSTPPPVISVALSPNSAQALDVNQSDSFTATVNNDSSNQGVSWTVTCPAGAGACGAMAHAKTASGAANQYVAPASVSTTVTVTVIATSVSDATKSASVHLTVNPALALVNPPPPQPQAGLVGGAFSFNLADFVQGGTAPFAWAIKSGTLPAGLTLDAKTGMITGIPTTTTSAPVVVVFTCTDSGNPSTVLPADLQISLTINTPAPLTVTSGTPPTGVVGRIYDVVCNLTRCFSGFHLNASGGISPYHWSWAPAQGSSLPPGLGLVFSSAFCPLNAGALGGAAICGTPSAAGPYNVILTVTDSASPAIQTSVPRTFVINNPPPPTIPSQSPSAGAVNLPYSYTFTASQGLAPLSWSETGALPPGLNLSTDGVLSGTPTATGSFLITVDVTDSIGRAAHQDFTLQIYAHGFAATGGMGTARYSHTATLLNDGKVLVTGGHDLTGNQFATAELFNPTSSSFTPTGSMGTARQAHTATLLNNGKVLVMGGLDVNDNGLATAELFDPTNGSFAPTGSLETARGWHTATLLKDGKVLVTGGSDATGNPLATAELFDPTSGTFTPTGSMAIPRKLHTATLLTNGKVLVAGGTDNIGNAFAEAELFDPTSGTFSPTGNMQSPRWFHKATLLNDGKVLVTGGVVDVNGNVLATAELFDPASASFTPTGSMGIGRARHTATLLNDGQVLVAGGDDATGFTLATAELFDPTSGSFAPIGSMTTRRKLQTATLLNDGKVLVAGGDDGFSTLATAELYQ